MQFTNQGTQSLNKIQEKTVSYDALLLHYSLKSNKSVFVLMISQLYILAIKDPRSQAPSPQGPQNCQVI